MSGFFTLLACALIGAGAFKMFAKDLLWRWTQFNYRAVGLTARRTASWERLTTTYGAILIAVGVAVFVLAP